MKNKMIARLIIALMPFFALTSVYAQSHTLPILRIDTKNHQPIISKTVYVDATYSIEDPTNVENNLGSETMPFVMQIRGRGNSSWRGQKKPYKIRLNEKHPVLGMPKNKHWVLLPFGDLHIAGMKLGKLMGMDWCPNAKPIELVLNGDYRGLYLITENNRIGTNRVNIYKQPDMNDDETTIPYGWLVEVDNYYGPDQIMFRENTGWNMNVTYHSPDTLSAKQKDWLLSEFETMNKEIYTSDKANGTWENYIDVEAMARFFIVQEVMDNPDGFHGSFFLHKDMGDEAKWVAGPLWDLNCLKREKTDYTFNMKAPYGFTPHWIGELIKDDDFCDAVRMEWSKFYPSMVEAWMNYLDKEILPCGDAFISNQVRWSGKNYTPLADKLDELKTALLRNVEWFNQHLPGHVYTAVDEPKTCRRQEIVVYSLEGMKISEGANIADAVRALPKGIYVINGKKVMR